MDTILRIQAVMEPEIRAYITSLKQDYARYRMPLAAVRKAIDDSMKAASLTAILYEMRQQ
jgi:hypothetical protein